MMLGRLDMFSNYIPDIDLFVAMHIVKEATQSTKIEGTQTNIEDALMSKEDVPLDKRDDWAEVQNYISAMNSAIKELEVLPLSSRLIRDTHKVLMQGVRGEYKQPGDFRTSQNWIGGSNITDAIFVPPVYSEIPELMTDIEKFIHEPKCELPDLVKIAIIHYQFETIHPFNDGNGRVGRLLITLYLVSRGLLKRPVLYLSDYLEHHRNSYYTSIMNVRTNNDMAGWLNFFLDGVAETAEKSVATFNKILDLDKMYREAIKTMGSRSANALKLLEHLYSMPFTDAARTSQELGVTYATANTLLTEMVRKGVLQEMTKGRRGRKYVLGKYLELFGQ